MAAGRPLRARAAPGSVGVPRRALLGGVGVLGVLAAAGCTGDRSPAPTPSTSAPRPSVAPADRRLVWANWPEYIDVTDDGTSRPTLAGFTEETGVPVEYTEVIEDNQAYVDSIRPALEARRPVGADVLTLTTWMSARLARAGLLQPYGPVERASSVVPALARPDWDPRQELSMPWQAGLTGIAYDARRVGRAIGSVAELFTRADLEGGVGVLTEFNDTIGFGLLAQGKDVTTATATDVESAVDYLRGRRSAGQLRGFYGNDYLDELAAGRLAATMAWSGDILQAQVDNPYLKFVVPEEGLMIWSDNLVVPAGSTQWQAAATLADHYYRPEVAARVAAWVNYICPVVGAQEAMAAIDPDLAASPLIFPDSSILGRSFQLPRIAEEDRLRAAFAEVAG